jgi:glycine cleavage system H protein
MNIPQELRYTKSHEWARQESGEILVGITAHAQEELRDVVYVELPAVGKAVKQGEPAAVVESVKAAFDIYAPVSGTVTKINQALPKSPQIVNQDCYGQGWFFAVKPGQPAEWNALMAADAYAKLIQTPTH